MMRRILFTGLSLILILLFAACQPTPEKGVVAEKDSERLLEKARKGDTAAGGGKGLREQYGIPETYQFELEGAKGKLNVKVDARVVVPEGNAMPIYRVKAADFTQEQVDAFWAGLVGDAQMWRMPEEQTKSEIEQNIVNWKKFMKEEGMEDSEQALADLAELEKALLTAPETIEEERCYGQLETMYFYKVDKDLRTKTQKLSSYTGLRAYEKDEDGGIVFGVQNNDDLKEAWFVTNENGGAIGKNVQRSAAMWYADNGNPASMVNFGYSPPLSVWEDGDLDAALLENIGIQPSEAIKMVQDLLDRTGANIAVDSVYYMDDEQKGYVDGEVRAPKNYAYKVFCVRTAGGLPCAYIEGESEAEPGEGEMEFMAPSWAYEQIAFRVNAEGIFDMSWRSPLQIVETVNEDAQLKPFSEIREIFEKMMRIKYEADPNVSMGGGVDFEIDRVTLSLQRIAEQNSFEHGLLVPAWNFYGKKTEHYEGGDSYDQFGMSFMSINAVDGSIIDIAKGY